MKLAYDRVRGSRLIGVNEHVEDALAAFEAPTYIAARESLKVIGARFAA